MLLLLGLVAAFALVVACGGDDDDDDGGDGNGAVIGGGDGGGGGTGSDERFVADICKAGAKFSKDIDEALKDVSSTSDPDKIAEKFIGPFEDFAKAFDKAKPPKDLKDWHEQATRAMNQLVKDLKENKGFDTLASQEEPFPDPPEAAEERLTKIAEKNKDCQEAGFFDE